MITVRQTRHEDMQSTRKMDGPRRPTARMVGAGVNNEEDGHAKAADNDDGRGGQW